MKKKNFKKSSKQLIAVLLILATFSILSASLRTSKIMFKQVDTIAMPEIIEQAVDTLPVLSASEEPTVLVTEVATPVSLAVCDLNNDGFRDLRDVSEFAGCRDTFDANGDGIHDLSDISLYASQNQDNDFCQNSFVCEALPAVKIVDDSVDARIIENEAAELSLETQLDICDHNGDRVRNLSDVAIFAACTDTFDANGDGIHDLSDISLYASQNQDNAFCQNSFVCEANGTTEPIIETGVSSGGSSFSSATLEICDHDNNGVRNLSDVAIFAGCTNTFDADNDGDHDLNDVALYTANHQDNNFCHNIFTCQAQLSSTTPQVLGEKISTCKIDSDVVGKTQWAEGSLIRGCDMKVYRIENQQKRHILSLKDLFKYIGQRIYNVTDDIIALF